MMKKLIAMLMVLLMITAVASADGWEEGLGPTKPYENLPEVDFSKQLGYIMFHPNSSMSVAGANTLFIYLPRDDVQVGSGKHLTLRSADQGEEFRVVMDDTTYVTQRPMYDVELMSLMWGGGTCIEIKLPVSLRVGATYYVDLEENSIVDVEQDIGSQAFRSGEQDGWYFTTFADFGVNALEYRRADGEDSYEGGILNPQAGDEVCFELILGGDAVSATVFAYGDITFEEIHFTEGCEIIGTVTGSNPDWEVVFWDTEAIPAQDEMDAHTVAWVAF